MAPSIPQYDASKGNTDGVSFGVFSPFPVATPKYAIGDGPRGDLGHNLTRARLFVQTSNDAARQALIDAVTAEGNTQYSQELVRAITSNFGFVDFFLQSATHVLQEKSEVVETVNDGFVGYFFGSAASTFHYTGQLLNTQEDDQAVGLLRLYRDLLRGSELARRRLLVTLAYDSYLVSGALLSFQDSLSAENELVVPCSFSLLVQEVQLRESDRSSVFQSATSSEALDELARASTPAAPVQVGRVVAVPPPASQAAALPPSAPAPTERPLTDRGLFDSASSRPGAAWLGLPAVLTPGYLAGALP